MVKIVSIADETYRELASPSDLSIAAISFWLRTNLGQLNNLINTSYALDVNTQELETGLSIEEAVIFKKLYFVHYYDIKIRATLGAASSDSVVEVSSDGARVRKINKNEISKTWMSARNLERDELTRLITAYKLTESSPRQVAGDDTITEGNNTRAQDLYNRSRNYL
tara:strand:- start:41 stop:541 length:501 start_codon:yes stop_codon:yes gene_type:complete